MSVTIMAFEAAAHQPNEGDHLAPFPLTEEDRAEVLAFLAVRPLHTVYMASIIRDNGVMSLLNRGAFYGCRDAGGKLIGVGLVGHAIQIEARCAAAVVPLARLARQCPAAYFVRGEPTVIESFWRSYSTDSGGPHRVCRELLYELREPYMTHEPVHALRRATVVDLELVLAVNSAMTLEACGVNPLERDPVGFRVRAARRIEQGRVWLWREGARLVFKAEVIAETPEAAYLEGVHVHPEERGRGYGARCLAQLSRQLLARTEAVCLTAREGRGDARVFYEKIGYRFHTYYETVYLQGAMKTD